MGTKSTRSSGTQINARGITQGNTLVGPNSGLPIDEVVDNNGVRRLAVDAALTLDTVTVDIDDLTPDKDQVSIGDHTTGNSLEIEPDGSINANVEVDAADGDNIAIHDADGDELEINSDGSVNTIVSVSNPGTLKSFYNEITSVAASVLSSIQTYTVPVVSFAYLQKVEVSGTNIAEYTIEINSVVQDKKRTYFSGSLNTDFTFVESGTGIPLSTGDIVEIKVVHLRPTVGDFNSRIQVIEV